MRAAIYARYSSDLQRPTSIEDQVRQCKRAAELKGWAVLEEYIRSDHEISGASLNQREGLTSLMDDAKKSPRPFDCLLVDDTSRLGRNLTDVLRISDVLSHYGIFLFFVSQHLESRDRSFRQLLIMNGMVDEQFLIGLAEKVHRGQEGRVLSHLVAGGRCYGYKNVPIEDFSRIGEYGRPAVQGVRQEILPEEASVIRRMFDMYGSGASLATIAKTLCSENVPPPRPRSGTPPGWCPSGLFSMLRNERYRGRIIWNKSRSVRNPETGIKYGKLRAEDEWVIVDAPELRIISDEQWEGVQAQIRRNSEKFGKARLGGLDRIQRKKDYLFSGLLLCGICGYRMVIVGGALPYARYGCPVHRFKGACPNEITIRYDRLETQLIEALTKKLLQPEMLEYAISEFSNRIQRAMVEADELRSRSRAEAPRFRTELRKLELQVRNLADAIKKYGTHHSPTLLSELSYAENRIDFLKQQLAAPEMEFPEVPPERIREFVLRQAAELCPILIGDRVSAKQALRRHLSPLVLSPKTTPEGPVFQVNGVMDLFSGLSDVMLLAAPLPDHLQAEQAPAAARASPPPATNLSDQVVDRRVIQRRPRLHSPKWGVAV